MDHQPGSLHLPVLSVNDRQDLRACPQSRALARATVSAVPSGPTAVRRTWNNRFRRRMRGYCVRIVFILHYVFLSWGNFLVTQKMYYDHGVNKRVYICGAADSICLREICSVVIFSCKSIRCLSYSGGILSEGDKRDSKGDMPRPFSSHQQTDERDDSAEATLLRSQHLGLGRGGSMMPCSNWPSGLDLLVKRIGHLNRASFNA